MQAFSRRQLFKSSLPLFSLPLVHLQAEEQRPSTHNDIWRTGNANIDAAREIGLSLLKPTQAQLQRAWELHFNSLVFESYGFAPRAAIDAEAYQKAYDASASPAALNDLREDMSMTRVATDEVEKNEFFQAIQAAGVQCIFQNAGEESSHPSRLLKRLARFTYITDLLRGKLDKAVTAEQIETSWKAGIKNLCFTTNGVPLSMSHDNVQDEWRPIQEFLQLGVKMMHVTYNRRNALGDGVGEPRDAGLSDFGHATLKELNRLGIIIDVSHSGQRTSFESAKASSRPMVASHTTCNSLYDHFRGKSDATLRAICDTDGLIGICCIPQYLGGAGDLLQFVEHLDYLVKTFGAEHAAIGTDVAYTSRNHSKEIAKLSKRADGKSILSYQSPRWEHLWPKDPFKPASHAVQSMAWTNWPLFTVAMVQKGYTDAQIQQILGQNMLRVLRAQQA